MIKEVITDHPQITLISFVLAGATQRIHQEVNLSLFKQVINLFMFVFSA